MPAEAQLLCKHTVEERLHAAQPFLPYEPQDFPNSCCVSGLHRHWPSYSASLYESETIPHTRELLLDSQRLAPATCDTVHRPLPERRRPFLPARGQTSVSHEGLSLQFLGNATYRQYLLMTGIRYFINVGVQEAAEIP